MEAPYAQTVVDRALRRMGIDPVEYARPQVGAIIADSKMWELLVRAASPSHRLTRLSGVFRSTALPFGRADILVSDLRSYTKSSTDSFTRIRDGGSPFRVVLWSPLTAGNADIALELLRTDRVEIIWREASGEFGRLQHVLRTSKEPSGCALVGHLLVSEFVAFPGDIRLALLSVLGGCPLTGRRVISQLHLSERTAERVVQKTTDRTLGDYVRRLRHVAAWDRLQAGATVPEAAQAAAYRSVRAYNDACRALVGLTPLAATKRLSTEQFVRRVLT
jgi:AraC-like DNA-binding protein